MFGFLNIDKPAGLSSYDVIRHLRRQLPRGEAIGHAGTLDPFATGVLVVTLGLACRLVPQVQGLPKEYRATVCLGATSPTDDPTSPITPTAGAAPPSAEQIRQALAAFVGTIQQRPPAHSAIRVQGRRAYHLARKGEAVDLKPRPVTIHAIELVSYGWPSVDIRVACGSGTYIRSLARDLGANLGVGGYCQALTRTRVGPFTLKQACDLTQVRPEQDLIPPLAGLPHLPQMVVKAAQLPAVAQGKWISLTEPLPAGEVAIVDSQGRMLAIGRSDGRRVRPSRVFLNVSTYDGPGRS